MAKGVKTGGRTKGTPNKTTSSVKEALEKAFDEIGGIASLVAWARDDPAEFYKLWGKLIPREMSVDVNGKIELAAKVQEARERART